MAFRRFDILSKLQVNLAAVLAIVAAITLALCFSSCSSSVKVTGATDLPKIASLATGAAIPIRLETTNPRAEGGCIIEFHKSDNLARYDVEFKVGADTVFAELPPGNYRYHQVSCGRPWWDVSFYHWPQFQVFPGKIALVEGLNMYLSEGENMTFSRSNREKSRDQSLSFFGRLPAEDQSRVVSAYTGKPVTGADIEKSARWKNWDIKDSKGQKPKEFDWPSFHACYHGENEVNGLWLGNLQYEVVYDHGELQKLTDDQIWNSLTEHFSECVKDSLGRFHPKNKSKITYTLYL